MCIGIKGERGSVDWLCLSFSALIIADCNLLFSDKIRFQTFQEFDFFIFN